MKCCEKCELCDFCQAGFWSQCDEYKKELRRSIQDANKQHRVFSGLGVDFTGIEETVGDKSNSVSRSDKRHT